MIRLIAGVGVLLSMLSSGCGGSGSEPTTRSALAVDLARTRPFGIGPAFRPAPVGNPAVAAAEPVGRFRCARSARAKPYGAHIELFAAGRGVFVPAGIGIAPPQRRRGAFVLGGRCLYPLRTVDPTGVVLVAAPVVPTVGELFELWGQPLSPTRLAGFKGTPVIAFVDGRRWPGDPRSIPLRRHAQIELELGPTVEPHPTYTFPPGL
jgi:hypothetical protein